MVIRARRDKVAVHCPVVIFTESKAVGRVVVAAFCEGDEVGGIDEGDIVARGQADAEAAGGALVIVDFEYLAAESGRTAVFKFVLGNFGRRKWHHGSGFRPKQNRGMVREVAENECFTHFLAVLGDGDEELEPVGESGVDLADVGDTDFTAYRCGPVGFEGLPETVSCQIAEGKIWVVLVVVFADEEKAGGKSVAEFLAPRDSVGCGKPCVEQIESGKEEQGLVWAFVWRSLLHRRGSDIEVVKAFDGRIEEHMGRKA